MIHGQLRDLKKKNIQSRFKLCYISTPGQFKNLHVSTYK